MLRSLHRWSVDVRLATALLTRVPLPALPSVEPDDIARAVRAYPLVGAVVGLVLGLVMVAVLSVGVPALVAASITLAIGLLVTGALHEDGLADTADGLGGGRDVATKLNIMRDHHIGSYGTLALVLTMVIKAACLQHLALGALPALVTAHALSRAVLGGLLAGLPPARPDGLARLVGRPSFGIVAQSALLGIGVVVMTAEAADDAALMVAVAGATAWAMGLLALRHVGGVTGDICGATQQAVETMVLIAWCVR